AALPAQAGDFKGDLLGPEVPRRRRPLDRRDDIRIAAFLRLAAAAADQEIAFRVTERMAAPDKRVETADLVDKAMFGQEIKCPVDRRRLYGSQPMIQLLEQIIGFDRPVAFPDQFQHLAADLGKAHVPRRADSFRLPQRVGNALVMGGAFMHEFFPKRRLTWKRYNITSASPQHDIC